MKCSNETTNRSQAYPRWGAGVAKVTPSEYQKWRQKEKIGNNYKGKKGKKHTGEKLQN